MTFRLGSLSARRISPPALIILFVLSVTLSVFGLVGWKAWDTREALLARSAKDTQNLSRSLAQHASRTLEAIDLVLSGIVERVANTGWGPDQAERISQFLVRRAEQLSQIRELAILDASGHWKFASIPQLPAYSNADRDYFKFHRDHADQTLQISQPLKSRNAQRWSLIISRRINDRAGNFAGVVLAAVDLDYFQNFYNSFDIGANGGIAVFRDDGFLLVRKPFVEDNVGRDFSSTSFFREHVALAPSGYYRATSVFDGTMKRTAYERLPEYPVVVSVTVSEDEILAGWRKTLGNDLLLATLVSGIVALMGAFVAVQLRRRLGAEATLRQSEERYRLLADNCTDLIFQLDLEFVHHYASPASQEILGYSPDEMIGTKALDHIHPEDTDDVFATYQAVASGLDRASVTHRIQHRDSRWMWVETELRLVRAGDTGEPVGILGALRDISVRKAIEAEATEARRQAEQAAEAQGQFLATMSHELRTPLNSVLGFADIILDRKDLVPEVRRQVGLIQTAGSFLLTVVNDVLDFSKIEEGKLELVRSEFSLPALIDNSISVVRDFAVKKKLDLSVRTDPNIPAYVVGDEGRLRQVLLNLLNNAIKFTQAGRIALTIEHRGAQGSQERIRFAISDTGIGIPADRRDRLFRRFSQVDGSTSREFGGSGLGLAICKRLVELMGGEIGVESRTGEGSTFWFTVALPAADAPRREELSEETMDVEAPSRHILVVEDVDVNQEIARSFLEAAGHQVDVVADGSEAITAVQAHPYDIVLMDIQMPIMDGVTATKHIRKLAGSAAGVPIIAMTANVLPQQVESFRAAGMDGHVGKPLRRADLLEAIERCIGQAALSHARSLDDEDAPVLDEPPLCRRTSPPPSGREKLRIFSAGLPSI